jgi:maltooligosyltrehalose synthase
MHGSTPALLWQPAFPCSAIRIIAKSQQLFGTELESVEEFHRLMRARARASPHTMSATATHDAKRGEDARARILALGELAQEWGPRPE